jgi:two-component system, NtrC family, nitrogen regulation sensor histidine kinase NtrY
VDSTSGVLAVSLFASATLASVFWRQRQTARLALAAADKRVADGQNLLSTVVEAAPIAMVLLRGMGTIVLANSAARELLFDGEDAVGQDLLAMMARAPSAFRAAMQSDRDVLFTVGSEGDDDTYHLAKRTLRWQDEPLTLILLRHLTRELRRQEVAVWKKLLRVISHELNNSLAPISSLAQSGRQIANEPDKLHMLERVFAGIEQRTQHLEVFLEGYASLARLPSPRPAHVLWTELATRIHELKPRVALGAVVEGTGWVDPRQLEQLLLNLIKNAEEVAGATEISFEVRRAEHGAELIVSDRGPGMSADVLRNALLPFYSTKATGTGLGLALCREIVEAHNGKISLANREGGGLQVVCFFPDANVRTPTQGRLTITRY